MNFRAFYKFILPVALVGCPYASGQNEKLMPPSVEKDPEATALPAAPPGTPKARPVVTGETGEPEALDAGSDLAQKEADAGSIARANIDAGATAKGPAKAGTKTPTAIGAVVATPSTDPVTCGSKDNPCPMQKFMRTAMASATSADALAAAFARATSLSPDGGWQWKAIAQKGADLAKSGDVPGAKQQCKACHEAYKEKYKAQYRARAVK